MTAGSAVTRQAWMTYAGLALLVAVVWLATLDARPLFNPDEGRYAEIPREMLASGDWLIPHLNGIAYLEKPPLQYWLTAGALATFGTTAFAARLYTAACAIATLAVVWAVAGRLWGTGAAWRAAALLCGMPLFVVLGQLLTLDMSLSFYMTLSLAGFLLAQRHSRSFMWIAWAAAALGVLTKGPVAAVLPAGVLVLYTLLSGDRSPWRRLELRVGVPLFSAITVPWHWLAARRLPDFLGFYFVHEHVSRYLTPSADRQEVWWFFLAVFVLGSLPFAGTAARAVLTGWRRRAPPGEFDAVRFLWVWVVFVVVFFSVSDSKLIPYILPALPALALLIAASPVEALRRELAGSAALSVLAGALSAAAIHYAPGALAPTPRNACFLLLARPLAEVAALLAVTGLFVALRRGRDPTEAAVFLGVGWSLAALLLMRAAAAVAPIYSGVVLARAIAPPAPSEPVYSVRTYDQTVPFYWARTVRLVAYRGELDFGLTHDPGAEVATLAGFEHEWQQLSAGYAIMDHATFEDLRRRGLPMREVTQDIQRVLVARR